MEFSEFGEHITPLIEPMDANWIQHSCTGSTSTVGSLLPNVFDSVIRISAPHVRAANWWKSYRDLFISVQSICSRNSQRSEVLFFGVWEGHGFYGGNSDSNFATIPSLEMPNRNYFLLFGNSLSLSNLRYPGSDDWRNPDLMWPDDRSWFIGTDVDFWSLYVGGTTQMIQEIEDQFGNSCKRVAYTDKLVIED